MISDRSVVITGATGGIGGALVDRFLANGDRVVAVDLDQATLDAFVAQRDGQPVSGIATDISNPDDCARCAQFVEHKAGTVDVLVNCAGYFPIAPFESTTIELWRRVIDVNLTGTFLMTKAMFPMMKGSGWGRIVNFGSSTFHQGSPMLSPYVASKGGVIGLSRSLASEFGQFGITVNVVTPGLTVTEKVAQDYPAEMLERARTTRPITTEMRAKDQVGAVFFLASPEADFITGQIVNVDGGSSKH